MKKYAALLVLLAFAVAFVACGDESRSGNSQAFQNPNDTPTDAYKRLYAAVKSRNTEAIKAEVSQATQSFAMFVADQQKVPVEQVFANGFTQTTFADTLPEIRDERVKGDMGAVEVWSAKGEKWEDVPFVREESGWKLAVGDAFRGSWKSPGKGRSTIDQEAANAMSGNSMINGLPNVNIKPNSKVNK